MSTRHQIEDLVTDTEKNVLQCLNFRLEETKDEEITTEIGEISNKTGINDKDEVLRALYSLEGRSLVSPFPSGDFTSNRWKITSVGVKALTILN